MIFLHPKALKKSKKVSILENDRRGFVTLSDHCAGIFLTLMLSYGLVQFFFAKWILLPALYWIQSMKTISCCFWNAFYNFNAQTFELTYLLLANSILLLSFPCIHFKHCTLNSNSCFISSVSRWFMKEKGQMYPPKVTKRNQHFTKSQSGHIEVTIVACHTVH